MMKPSPIFQENSLSAKTPGKVSTTPNLLPLKISPDDEHTKLEKSAMPFMPSLYSPQEDEEEKQTPFLAMSNEHESFSLALPAMFQDPFSMDDHESYTPFQARPKKRSHGAFVLRPRRGDRTGMETPFQEVGADNLPRKRPRMPLFVSLDGDAHNDNHLKPGLASHAQDSELEAYVFASASNSSSPSYTNSSISPRWSCQMDDLTKSWKSTSSHGLDDTQVYAVESPYNPSKSGTLQGPDYGETVIALPRVFRPTIRRMATSPSKSRQTHGLPRVFAPSSTSAFSLSQGVKMVITPSSKPTSPI